VPITLRLVFAPEFRLDRSNKSD